MFLDWALFVFLVVIIFLSLNRKKQETEFPSPPGIFFIGHAWELRSTTNILNAFSRFIRDYGKTISLRVGPVKGLVTTDYNFTEFLLSGYKGNLKKSQNYLYLVPWLGSSGLLLSDGGKWKHFRKFLTPAFHFEILKEFIETFSSVGDILIENLNKLENTTSIDIQPLFSLCMLDIILETAMGVKIHAQKCENSEYVNSVQELCRIITDRCLSPLKIYNFTFMLTKDYRIQKKVVKILHDFTTVVINNKKEETKNKDLQRKKKKLAFLDLLMKTSNEGESLNVDELKDQLNTFLFAGHHTTASGICFTLFCLAEHPEIQDKIINEQKMLFGEDKDPPITYQNLQDMKYLEMVIKEALRLYPPVPIIGRFTTEEIEFDSHVIPAGTNIAIFIYGIHRNPKYYPEPEKFDPNRFENFDTSNPYRYIPFSAGSRNCIGMKFAMLEMKCIISKIIRHFLITPVTPNHKLVLAAETVLKSVNGIKVGLKKRH